MKLTIRDSKGQDRGELEVHLEVIDTGKGTQAVHDTVVAHNAAQRSGTACTKTMGDVAGSGKKPWRQKGTGRARAGSFASPLWRGGGVTHGPKPRDFRKKISKATRNLALRKAISERLKAGDILIVDDLKLASPKTKEFVQVLSALGVKGHALFVVQGADQNLTLATRNLSGVKLTTGETLNSYEALRFDKLVFTRGAFEKVEARLQKEKAAA